MEFNLQTIGTLASLVIAFYAIGAYRENNLKKLFITGKRMDTKLEEFKETMDEKNELKFANKDIVTELKTKIDIYVNGGK